MRRARAELLANLRDRLPELEAEIRNRVEGIGSPEINNPGYRDGLGRAVAAAIEYGLATAEVGERDAGPAPVALLAQARLAARHRVGLGTMHRRYVAGKHLLAKAIRDEARQLTGLRHADLERLLSSLATVFDRLLARLEEEYEHEARLCPGSSQDRRAERVKRLLAGELIDTSDLPYDFEVHHVGVVAEGEDAAQTVRALAKTLDAHPLVVRPEGEAVWAWLGTRRPVCRHRLGRTVVSCWPPTIPIGLGEPDQGLAGWRRTHRQARAVAPTARGKADRIGRYAEDAIVATIERDDLLAASLRKLYVDPLEEERDHGLDLLGTLRAYLAAGGNGASAAAALDLTRQTVSNRLKRIEERLGRSLTSNTADIEIALRLAEVDRPGHK